MNADKPGSPPCGIYVRIDDFSNMLDVIGWVRKMAFAINQRSGYEKNMSVVEVGFSADYAERARDIVPIIQDQGLVAIMHDTFDPMGADGLLIDHMNDISKARSAIGDDGILGVSCTKMPCDKVQDDKVQGIDYAILNADPAIIGKWKINNDSLCVARGKSGITADNCGALVKASADFVDVSDYILNHKKDIMQGTVNILYEIQQAAKKPRVVN